MLVATRSRSASRVQSGSQGISTASPARRAWSPKQSRNCTHRERPRQHRRPECEKSYSRLMARRRQVLRCDASRLSRPRMTRSSCSVSSPRSTLHSHGISRIVPSCSSERAAALHALERNCSNSVWRRRPLSRMVIRALSSAHARPLRSVTLLSLAPGECTACIALRIVRRRPLSRAEHIATCSSSARLAALTPREIANCGLDRQTCHLSRLNLHAGGVIALRPRRRSIGIGSTVVALFDVEISSSVCR